jgi:molybdopterin/thiamine biosynthesis adenylyltransferase
MGMDLKESTLRFSDAYFYMPDQHVSVLGTGGIGSWVALLLGRQDCILYLYDMDTVEKVNLAGQFYKTTQIGNKKVEATKFNVNEFCDLNYAPQTFSEFNEESFVTPIMFSCFDNMKARKLAFTKWKAQEDREIFIDGRMALVTGEVYSVIKGKEEDYEKTLFDDSEVEEAACSMKATTHSATLIASLMVSIYTNYIGLKKDPLLPLYVPFFTSYNIPLMNIEC